MDTLAIEVNNLNYFFRDKEVLKGIDLRIKQDTIYGLIGKNGAGKTTLMHVIINQLIAKEGDINILGKDPRRQDDILEEVCMVGEEEFYAPYMRVKDIFKMYERFYSHYDRGLESKLIEFFELPIHKALRHYSRGMKSLVFAIIGLCSRARITILDEPTLGMDAENREAFYKILLDEYIKAPRTLIISTHLIDEIEHLIEEMVILDKGKVILNDAVEQIKSKSYYLIGQEKAFEVLHRLECATFKKMLGSKAIYVYWGEIEPQLKEQMRRLEIEMHPMSLQEIFLEKVGGKEYRDE
ncbi:MAG: ABC transporter ATP-binding protein [Cellulosilyticum sp.]|nr:ABC transporter ATP-binding protein [Cellulosilyticum sp.]